MLLTKLIAGLLMPVPVILGLLGLGLVLLLVRSRRLGGLLLVAGVWLLLALSLPQLSERMLQTLESQYPPLLEPPAADWIVVLGGGVKIAPHLPPASQLSPASLSRLAEGIRLHRLLPEARLAFSGSALHAQVNTAEVMAATAEDLGVKPSRLVLFVQPNNTAEEAQTFAERLGEGDTVILVTSASHMRRAVALFEAQGVSVVPAPAGHIVDPDRGERTIRAQLPQSKYLMYAEIVFWERLGLLWARLTGDV